MAARGGGDPPALRPRSSRPRARHLRADPVLQRAGADGLGTRRACGCRCRTGSTPRCRSCPGSHYPTYRIAIIVTALAVALFLYVLVMRTRLGMLIRAGASNREMAGALGVNIKLLYTLVFGLGAALAGLAGLMQAPILTVQIGMGENILILAFVVIIIGGIGSIRGAFVAAILVGLIDTIGRAFLPDLLRLVMTLARRVDRRAGAVVDDDLSGDGDRAGGAAAGPVPGVEQMTAWLHAAQRGGRRAARVPRSGAGLFRAHRQRLPDDAVHAHRHPGDGGDQPQSHPRLWRHGELRPRRLSRHRRLCHRHPGAGRRRLRLRPVAGRDRRLRAVRARRRRAEPAHPRALFHHDHARLRAARLLFRRRPRPLRRRRRPATSTGAASSSIRSISPTGRSSTICASRCCSRASTSPGGS